MHMDPHPFDSAIRLAAAGEGAFSGAASPAYADMVGPFGGIVCAVLLNAVPVHPQRQGEPVSLTAFFHADLAMLSGQSDRHVMGTARVATDTSTRAPRCGATPASCWPAATRWSITASRMQP